MQIYCVRNVLIWYVVSYSKINKMRLIEIVYGNVYYILYSKHPYFLHWYHKTWEISREIYSIITIFYFLVVELFLCLS